MATISKLKPGQVLWSLENATMGNTTIKRRVAYSVEVVSIADDGRSIMASWNHNPPRKYYASEVSKLRVNKPKPKGERFGMEYY